MDEMKKMNEPQQSKIHSETLIPPPPNPYFPYSFAPFDREAPTPYGAQTLAPTSAPSPPGTQTIQYGSLQYREIEFKNHVRFKIKVYTKQAKKQQMLHDISQIIIFVGAALVPVFIGILRTLPWIPALVSTVVAVTTAIANYYKFGDKSTDFHIAAESMEKEYNLFKMRRSIYKSIPDEEALYQFQDNIDGIQDKLFQSYLKNQVISSGNGGVPSSSSK